MKLLRSLLLPILVTPLLATAETAATPTPEKEKPAGFWDKFFIAPVPTSSPSQGSGLALNTMYLHDRINNDTPASTSWAYTQYTDTDSFMFFGGHKHYFKDDKWRAEGMYGYINSHVKHFGFDKPLPVPLPYNGKTQFVFGSLQKQFFDNWYIGGQFTYYHTQAKGEGPNPDQNEDFERRMKGESAGFGGLAQYDSRDNQFNATKGWNIEFSSWHYLEALGSQHNYHQLSAKASHYIELQPNHVLAFNGAYKQLLGDSPDYAQVNVEMRGFQWEQLRGNSAAWLQSEYRWKFAGKWTWVGFAGVAGIEKKQSSSVNDKVFVSGGTGIRYLLSAKEKLNIGIDVAASEFEHSFYLRMGEAF
ncbi:BamA/TamA family outer membrane protein [Paraferrimonas sp. SM1919]|uniref:BamA/TamA family outer membrane protein n=1 Tax=Paraferrimonas sp. SM1919 TaxID=2662263 RepID=UPI0013D0BE1E|nr:BamA/TamA family outer membrane protein [Paraferrimonas sp. SM1919]